MYQFHGSLVVQQALIGSFRKRIYYWLIISIIRSKR